MKCCMKDCDNNVTKKDFQWLDDDDKPEKGKSRYACESCMDCIGDQ